MTRITENIRMAATAARIEALNTKNLPSYMGAHLVEETILDHIGQTPERVVESLVDEVWHDEKMIDLMGLDPEEEDRERMADKVERALRQGLEELERARNHVCTFNEDDWCTCGRDGRM